MKGLQRFASLLAGLLAGLTLVLVSGVALAGGDGGEKAREEVVRFVRPEVRVVDVDRLFEVPRINPFFINAQRFNPFLFNPFFEVEVNPFEFDVEPFVFFEVNRFEKDRDR